MKKILAFVTMIALALGMCACKSEFSSKMDDAKDALEETCQAKKADGDQYDQMVNMKYQVAKVASAFQDGVYAEVKSKDFVYFGFHTVVDQSKIKSVFKYIKADPQSAQNGSVASMEVLVIEFKNGDAAQEYFDKIMSSRKKTYTDIGNLSMDMKNEFVEKKEYFAFASESEFMTYNAYASIDGSTVFYAYVEGPNADALKTEYYAFMKKMECSVITL